MSYALNHGFKSDGVYYEGNKERILSYDRRQFGYYGKLDSMEVLYSRKGFGLVAINYFGVQAYAQWLSARSGLNFNLPSEGSMGIFCKRRRKDYVCRRRRSRQFGLVQSECRG